MPIQKSRRVFFVSGERIQARACGHVGKHVGMLAVSYFMFRLLFFASGVADGINGIPTWFIGTLRLKK